MKVTLPDKPVDRYKIKAWSVNAISHYIWEITYTYHINTSWEDFKKETHHWSSGGRDIVDTWMLDLKGGTGGRIEGWKAILAYITNKDLFLTLEEAIESRKQNIIREAARHTKEVNIMLQLLNESGIVGEV